MIIQNRVFGLICIVLGTTIILLSAGQIILRVGIALIGLLLINYGLQLRNAIPLQFRAYRWFSSHNFRR